MTIIGWHAETTFGTSLISPTDDHVTAFGADVDDSEHPIPWYKIEHSTIWNPADARPRYGAGGVPDIDEFKVRVAMVGADEFKYALGTVAANVFTMSTTLPSRTVYIETDWGDVLECRGCVTKALDIFANQGEPIILEVTMKAATVVAMASALAPTDGLATARFHGDLNDEAAWGWGDNDALEYGGATIHGYGEITRIHARIQNILNIRRTNGVIASVKKKASVVELDFTIENALKTSPIVLGMRTPTVDDFTYEWARGVADTLKITASDVRFGSCMGTESPVGDGGNTYSAAGLAFGDDAFKFEVTDGVTY
jgi:hypothetical protein